MFVFAQFAVLVASLNAVSDGEPYSVPFVYNSQPVVGNISVPPLTSFPSNIVAKVPSP